MRPEAADIAGSARWHLHDYDETAGTVSLLRLDESHYRQASFLDQRVEATARERAGMSIEAFAAALAKAPATPEPRFIFHIGHCGSTLLSRALDASPATLPLREPLTLRRLAHGVTRNAARSADGNEVGNEVGNAERNAIGPEFGLAELVLQAHRRVFRRGQSAVIKATSSCNGLIRPLLEPRPGSRGLLVYVDLCTYLAGMLGRQAQALDLRGHLPARLEDWGRMTGAPAIDADALDESRLAVLAWLTGMRHLAVAANALPHQTRLLDFEAFLAAPEDQLAALAGWFGYGADTAALLTAWPEVATGYSKQPDRPYSAFNRRRTLARGRADRGSEIESGLRWAESLIVTVPDLAPCGPFLGGTATGEASGA